MATPTLYFSPSGATFVPVSGYTPTSLDERYSTRSMPTTQQDIVVVAGASETVFSLATGAGPATVTVTGPPGGSTGSAATHDGSNGLGTGAIVGIAVGVGGSVLLLVAGVFVFLWRKRRRGAKNNNPTSPTLVNDPKAPPANSDGYYASPPQQYASQSYQQPQSFGYKAELPATPKAELPAELPSPQNTPAPQYSEFQSPTKQVHELDTPR
ncbi:hypothetical protein W97_02250 [Coniosporium apollinis CBS 100218]|uniref:Mid2 domain-containing protein n=1 Tax=Coniosporium apollinis (strain CBS 100218) TaxID=1168221 RepID=R7YMH8_CONA1|nr:uncharacterized protein W97_02250 [Coniosporium apollinis CBS 100218]EON63024.1 hypothetical protein W97_02250 [Coniosporium apollinis CBS 100218]